ncbi:esterase/lipase family protein [Marinobacter orientalis]|uniref:Triacylglycerol lipase n=1 Tax=Marinobacter orientalis TaxID=1928859 RepID=A0A7Y0RCE1_9GAMM|nr:hypothetical protein [Marinobacter orientalis]NMT63646.1 hypothetical protein [Marinobacter orientalis]TGX49761.1 hypothetical protein DIT72_08560 [Marinobacter orientalis]
MTTTQIYLVPGFFGFTKLGAFNYFHEVATVIKSKLLDQGIDPQVIEVETIPTGSIRRRAEVLIEAVRKNGGQHADNLHFIGHSTGGLDIRLMLTPSVKLHSGQLETQIAQRTRSAISLSTPHHGTPMASFFTSMNGRNLLLILSLLATSRPGRYSIYSMARLLNKYARLDHLLGQRDDILDSLAENLLNQLRPDQGDAVWAYLRRIAEDQGAMVQLTPEGMDLFNAAVLDCRDVDYVGFITASPPPTARLLMPKRSSVYGTFTHLIYTICYQITQKEHPHYLYPRLDATTRDTVQNTLGSSLEPTSNDGIVPSLSQFWGKVGGVYSADHMDVVGQFDHAKDTGVYPTWMMSGSGFNEERFGQVWGDICQVVARNQKDQ